jgi:hypothetical protein
VELRKVHENGEVSRQQVRLSRTTFDDAEISMIYVSNGDRDADAFAHYQYKVDWNYRGNVSFSGDWVDHSGPSIPISPPLAKQSFKVHLDPYFADEQGVLGATVRIHTRYDGKEIVGPTLVLEPTLGSDEGYSASTTVLAAPERPTIVYSADLTLRDGRTLSVPLTETSSAIVVLNGALAGDGR